MNDIVKKLKELQEVKNLRKLKEEYQRLRDESVKGEEKLKKNVYQQEMRNNEIRNLDFNKKVSEEIKFSRETNTIKKLENIEKQLEKLDEKTGGRKAEAQKTELQANILHTRGQKTENSDQIRALLRRAAIILFSAVCSLFSRM